MNPLLRVRPVLGAAFASLLALAGPAGASSHREAPAITEQPKVDATDFYVFRSYETGRQDFVTLVACYVPLQDPYGGPNYFTLDPEALYEIHVDNDGDAREDLTFQFRFQVQNKDIALDVGDVGATKRIPIPLVNAGSFGAGDTAALNVLESYTVNLVRGDRRTGVVQPLTRTNGDPSFVKPHDNIGNKSISDYVSYAAPFVYDVLIPGSATPGRLFVGQRKDPFVVNLGETFDLINTNPLGPENGEPDDLADKNVTALCLEVPISLLLGTGTDPVIGAWTTASKRQARVLNPRPDIDHKPTVDGGAWSQVSRLGMPLVNEVVIGLRDKDRFNASEPKDDGQFADYVTHPTLPELIEILFPIAPAPNLFPRTDLVDVFLLGLTGLNRPVGVQAAEMTRLNTSTPVVAMGAQNRLGALGGDVAGFPNGRRPGDDVVDIELRVAMGALLPPAQAPAGAAPITDGAFLSDAAFDGTFPYLRTPLAGSPN